MKTMHFPLAAAALALLLFASAPGIRAEDEPPAEAGASAPVWHTDFAKASEAAREQGKNMLLNFSGLDWCGWCQRLDKEVFSHEAFSRDASKDFVLCQLDFPRKSPDPEMPKKRELAKKYSITGFPTVLLLDEQGRVFAKTGYQQGGPAAYVEHIRSFLPRKKEIAALLDAGKDLETVAEKGRQLEKAVETFGEWGILTYYSSLLDDLYALDPENKEGFRFKAAALKMASALRNRSRDTKGFQALLEEATALVTRDIEAASEPAAKAKVLDEALDTLEELKTRRGPIVVVFGDLLGKILEVDPENEHGVLVKHLGHLLYASLNAKDAETEEKVRSLIAKHDPDNEHGQLEQLLLADVQKKFKQKAFGEVVSLIDGFLAKHDNAKEGPYLRWAAAVSTLQSGDMAGARTRLARLLELHPASPFSNRAKSLMGQIDARMGSGDGNGGKSGEGD